MGGMNLVVSQLQMPDCSPLLFSYCCFSLGNLCLTVTDTQGTFSTFIRDENVINLLLKNLQDNIHDWQLVQQICFALGNIIFVSDFEELVLSLRGIEIVLEAMLKHRGSQCTVDVVFFLKNLSYGESARTTILQNDGVMKLLWTLEHQISNPDFCQVSLGLLFDLTFSGATRPLVQSSLGLRIIFEIILLHAPSDEDFMSQSINFLQRLFQTADHIGQIALISFGFVELIQQLNVPNHLAHTLYSLLAELPLCSFLPSDSVPSLKELAARKITNIQTSELPEDLKSYLMTRKSCCFCGGGFFEHFYQQLGKKAIEGYDGLIPVMITSCSKHCFDMLNKMSLM